MGVKRIRRGDVIYVDFGLTESSVQMGVRPAVVIQNDYGNIFSTTTIVVPMTRKIKRVDLPTHMKLDMGSYDFLNCDSMILGEQVLTISKSSILDYKGALSDDDKLRLNNILKVSMGL